MSLRVSCKYLHNHITVKLLILGHTIPEPTTTAAGSRMLQLITLFQEEGYTIHFATSALKNPRSIDLESIDVILDIIKLNDPSFDDYIIELGPDIVLYDRFVIEEHYGWRVEKCCPSALKILDTEDLHFLRKAREVSVKKVGDLSKVDLYTDATKRELASIMRCDLSLIISSYEMNLLTHKFGISDSILYYLPFMVSEIPQVSRLKSFSERNGFMTIGNLFHAPNVDSVLYLKRKIWPEIKKALPKATLSIYGNYAPQQINELHNEQEGFLIKGWAPTVEEVMSSAKVCLAPLRFGAGLKGKLLDAMIYGTPAVTTSVGAEAMYGDKEFFFSADSVNEIVELTLSLYTTESVWKKSQEIGLQVLKDSYLKSLYSENLKSKIYRLLETINAHRNKNFMSQILQHQTLQATRFMSKWIEEKNR